MEQLQLSTAAEAKQQKARQHPQFELPNKQFYNAIDRNNLWFPENLTVWAHLPSYAQLSQPAKLRYNHLYSVSVNEIFGIFERDFLSPILLEMKDLSTNEEQRDVLQTFSDEEIKHAQMFQDLNTAALPNIYKNDLRYFTTFADPIGLIVASLITRFPMFFGVWLWITIFFEERTIIFSKAFYKLKNKEVCEVFREVHKLHMIEEVHHVHLDETLVEWYYRPLGRIRKAIASWMFRKVIDNFSSPKRLSYVIANILKDEFPGEIKAIDACLSELPTLKSNARFQETYFGPQSAPRTWKLMSRFPELVSLIPKSANDA